MNFEFLNEMDLTAKTILEIGTGRAGTLFEIIPLLEKFPTLSLITTDVEVVDLTPIYDEFPHIKNQITFISTDAVELEGVFDNSIDIVFCYYTLCAINQYPEKAALALFRFYQILKPEGVLLIEEEFPIYSPKTPGQEVWAEKWALIKIILNLCLRPGYNEISPDILTKLLRKIGFSEIQIEESETIFSALEVEDSLERQLTHLMPNISSNSTKTAIKILSDQLKLKIQNVGIAEIPFYELFAKKTL